jgi:lipopolysaccharide transport system ATP-binding protein
MTEPILSFDQVSKRYRKIRADQRGGRRLVNKPIGRGRVSALMDASLEIGEGETVGLIGVNGSGKSTFLRLAAGVTAPSEGQVTRNSGRVGAILSLGDGFHPLLTGRENAMTGAILAGLSRREATQKMPEILEFCELGDAIDDPLRTYSSGMFVRLAFSVAAHVDADLLLVDEALAVGDLAFSQKCLDHLERIRAGGVTIVLASHDLSVVRRLCDRVAWFRQGRIELVGEPDHVIERYEKAMVERTIALTPESRAAVNAIGSGEVEIDQLSITTRDELEAESIPTGWPLKLVMGLTPHLTVDDARAGFSVHRETGERCLDLSTCVSLTAGKRCAIILDLERLDLAAGSYHIDAGVYSPDWDHAYDYRWQASWVTVSGAASAAMLAPPHTWVVKQ